MLFQRIRLFLVGSGLAAVFAIGVSCDSQQVTCPDVVEIALASPESATIKVGASIVATAGYFVPKSGPCGYSPPPRDMVWSVSDSTIVAVTRIDTIHSTIQGVRPGRAFVDTRYREGGLGVAGPIVTVVP
jgi:hypothetical protein